MFTSVKTIAARFHRDDEGMEAIQIIMILAVAAMVCLGVTSVTGISSDGTPGGGWFDNVTDLVSDLLVG